VSFEVIPAIDLRGGRCVRLFQGDYDRETQYSDDPVGVARRWEELGAPRLHVVDLDGAKDGSPANQQVMREICGGVSIPVEVSGGIRDLAGVESAFAYGAERVQLGSAAIRDAHLVALACQRFPGQICVSIDSRDGEVYTDGWRVATGRSVESVAAEMVELGVPRLMFTDIGRDATLTEPNFEALGHLVGLLPVPVVASGGVAETSHLVRLAAIGCEGAIVGKALYEGRVNLPEALEAIRGERH
jgi:phosphoribosylformimino-5-aminoimidazole carboxamide ribotide isomerase